MQGLATPRILQRPAQHAVIKNPCSRPLRCKPLRRSHVTQAERRFNESAAQVKRLLNRDRASVPDLDKPESFVADEDIADLTDDSAEAAPPKSSQRLSDSFPLPQKTQLAKPGSPFGGGAVRSPLGSQSPFFQTAANPFKEPSGLSPDMEISPISEEPWWKGITMTQVFIALSFVATIGLMVGTFWVVWKLGAIRLNE